MKTKICYQIDCSAAVCVSVCSHFSPYHLFIFAFHLYTYTFINFRKVQYNNKNNKPCKHQAASDADCLESYSKLFYWMESNDDRFKINSSTGIISIKKGSILDFDSLSHRNTINFIVSAISFFESI